MKMKNKIICGDCIEALKIIPDEHIDCIVTSPPYWGLRDYGVEGQIGLEPTLEEYHKRLLEVTTECKRVLKKTGTMFWVHGDSYGGSGNAIGHTEETKNCNKRTAEYGATRGHTIGFMPKCLLMQNYRLAERMVDEQGWILRNILIWHKKNHMPSSVQDRFTNAYEPVFFFSKSKKYWFDLDAIRVPHKNPKEHVYRTELGKDKKYSGKGSSQNTIRVKANKAHFNKKGEGGNYDYGGLDSKEGAHYNLEGKNPGDVFTLPTQPFPEAHFAVFPEKLIEPFIKAGCPAKGIVLDPFMGAGTTAVVAKKLGRDYIGIERNQEYTEIARKRISAIPQRLDTYTVF